MDNLKAHRHYHVVEQAIHFIRNRYDQQPTLAEIADSVHMSEFHLQRVFSEWAGISPKRFLQSITKKAAIDALKTTKSLIETSQMLGLSGTSRLHDLLVTCEAMTPGEMKSEGEGVLIQFGVVSTPFGEAVVGWTERGICFLQFSENQHQVAINELYRQWPNANIVLNNEAAERLGIQIFSSPLERGNIHLVLKGTNFQVKVWEALIHTHSSQVLSYSQVSQIVGSPKASRAVGTALSKNTIGYLIPCHRVIKGDGQLGNYRWGGDRKTAMIAWEQGSN